MVYKATVNTETYIGLTGGSFKQRYNGHQSSFRQKHKENETKLSKFIWELKDKGQEPKIQWECVVTAPTYSPNIGRCILCLREKEKILYYKEEATLNSRNEIISNCRHRRKFYLLWWRKIIVLYILCNKVNIQFFILLICLLCICDILVYIELCFSQSSDECHLIWYETCLSRLMKYNFQ